MPGRLYGDNDSSIGHRDETIARLKALGIDRPLFKSGPCVLPGHDHPARVNFTRFKGSQSPHTGRWLYYCEGLAWGVGLAEIRAFIAYGSHRHLSGVEAARWRELLDFEARLRTPLSLDVELPVQCPKSAQIVAGKMALLVGLRDRCFPFDEPFPFAFEFAQAYCGLTGDQVRAGKDWLERGRVAYRVGTSGKAILWKLAAQDVAVARGLYGGGRGGP
jgi:hypothetical protein